MTDIGPGEYWGSDYLLQAQKGYKRGEGKRGFDRAVRAIELMPTSWQAYIAAGDCLRMIARGTAHVVSADLSRCLPIGTDVRVLHDSDTVTPPGSVQARQLVQARQKERRPHE